MFRETSVVKNDFTTWNAHEWRAYLKDWTVNLSAVFLTEKQRLIVILVVFCSYWSRITWRCSRAWRLQFYCLAYYHWHNWTSPRCVRSGLRRARTSGSGRKVSENEVTSHISTRWTIGFPTTGPITCSRSLSSHQLFLLRRAAVLQL